MFIELIKYCTKKEVYSPSKYTAVNQELVRVIEFVLS